MSRDHHDDTDESYFLEPLEPLFRRSIIPFHLLEKKPSQSVTDVIISLDGSINSRFDWTTQFEQAQKLIENGYGIFFHLDMKLFSSLQFPLHHQGQLQSLQLSCRHFKETALPKFSHGLKGVILFSGDVPFFHAPSHQSHESLVRFSDWHSQRCLNKIIDKKLEDIIADPIMRWNYQRFCHEEAVDFLRTLSLELPDSLHRIILLNRPENIPLSSFLLHTAKDLLDPLHPAIESCISPFYGYNSVWNEGTGIASAIFTTDTDLSTERHIDIQEEESLPSALLLPSYSSVHYTKIAKLMNAIDRIEESSSIQYKIVHEPFFTSEWGGVDHILLSSESLTSETSRTLLGFQAAGGSIQHIT